MLLDDDFAVLKQAVADRGRKLEGRLWKQSGGQRALMPVAQADFYRFPAGWMPTHWKINDDSKRVALRVVRSLV